MWINDGSKFRPKLKRLRHLLQEQFRKVFVISEAIIKCITTAKIVTV